MAPPPARPSFWAWLGSLFRPARPRDTTARQRVEPGEPQRRETADLEARVVADFGRHYGLTFRDPRLLKLALTHRSYLHVTGQRESNERLEFLGDSVLGLVTSEYLYRTHPTEHEGQLTKTKSLLVSKAILSRRALAMGLGRFVLMSHSEVESGGRQRLSILADAFEAVVGAVYLDQGFDAAHAFIEHWLLRDMRTIVADKRHTNYKSHLQEYVQSTYRTHPVYRIRSEMGPDHSKQFMVEVIVGRRTLGQGKGRNKKEAEQAAARDALERVERGPTSDRERAAESRRPSPTQERPPRPAPVRKPPAPVIEVEEEVDELTALPGGEAEDREVISRRRRRGRRGGRGRRRPEASPSTTKEQSAPRTAPPASEEPKPDERPRGVRTRPPEMERVRDVPPPIEVEPLPPAHEENDLDDVGRPEGPPDEFRGGPESWLADLRSKSIDEPSPTVDRSAEGPPHVLDEASESETTEAAYETGEESPWPERQDTPEPVSEPPVPEPTGGTRPVQYGRRPGRTRR